MLFFFFINWFPKIPKFFYIFLFSTIFFFCKRLFFIKKWFFFFSKSSKILKSAKVKFKVKKKRFSINSFISKTNYNAYENVFKKLNLRLKKIFVSSLKLKFLGRIFYKFYWTSLSFIKNIISSAKKFFLFSFFFFKINVQKLKKKFFVILFTKFIRKKRKFRKRKWVKKYRLRTFFFKKNIKHKTYLKLKSKKQFASKALVYFYTLLWKKLQIYIPKRRRFRKFFIRKYFRRYRKYSNLKFFLKKITNFFSKKLKHMLFFSRVHKKYNNLYFPKLLNRNLNSKLYITQKKKKYLYFVKFFSFIISQFLENTLKNKFMVILKFFRNKRLPKPLRKQFKKVFYFQRKVGNGFFLREMLFIIWLSFRTKDLLFLVLWIKRTMERIKWRKQKIFLISLRIILRKSISPYFHYLRCYGYRFVLWGKIGVAGNSKTRNFVCKNKSYSLTTKTYKNTYEFTTVNTHTGVLGLSFFLVY